MRMRSAAQRCELCACGEEETPGGVALSALRKF
jgi:hypothetical protein